MTDYLKKYGYAPDMEKINMSLSMIASNLDKLISTEVLKDCFSMMDLTTLHTQDTPGSVDALESDGGLVPLGVVLLDEPPARIAEHLRFNNFHTFYFGINHVHRIIHFQNIRTPIA